MRIHLDTDLGGDPDDVCALALLLGAPDAELVAVTTVADGDGRRAARVAHLLELADAGPIPLAAGAGASLTSGATADPEDDPRQWPAAPAPRPSPPGAALDLLSASVGTGATIVAIGPATNLALLELVRPGTLGRARVVLMGGWTGPPRDGLPRWGPEMDWNVQWDTRATEIVVAAAGDLTLATLPATMLGHLRAANVPRLRAAGPLGALIARQAEAHGERFAMARLGRDHAGLPDDLLNFQYDPVACTAALGRPEAVLVDRRLRPVRDDAVLRFAPDEEGRTVHVLVDLDAAAFRRGWLTAVEAADRGGRPATGG